MSAAQLRAGQELAAAMSLLVLLQKCERATGRRMVTRNDEWRAHDARKAWIVARRTR